MFLPFSVSIPIAWITGNQDGWSILDTAIDAYRDTTRLALLIWVSHWPTKEQGNKDSFPLFNQLDFSKQLGGWQQASKMESAPRPRFLLICI